MSRLRCNRLGLGLEKRIRVTDSHNPNPNPNLHCHRRLISFRLSEIWKFSPNKRLKNGFEKKNAEKNAKRTDSSKNVQKTSKNRRRKNTHKKKHEKNGFLYFSQNFKQNSKISKKQHRIDWAVANPFAYIVRQLYLDHVCRSIGHSPWRRQLVELVVDSWRTDGELARGEHLYRLVGKLVS